jgi:hypothetical protein
MKKLHGGASAAPAVLACLYVAPAMTLIAASWAATRIPSPGTAGLRMRTRLPVSTLRPPEYRLDLSLSFGNG